MRLIREKKGGEYVEAAIVLPILTILTICFVIAAVFTFKALKLQCSIQKEVLERADETESIYEIVEGEGETVKNLPGDLVAFPLIKIYDVQYSAIDEASIVMIKGKADEIFKIFQGDGIQAQTE